MANNYDDPTAGDVPAAADHDGTIKAMKEQISQLTSGPSKSLRTQQAGSTPLPKTHRAPQAH